MQPVLEFSKRGERSYTYSIRAPHKHGPVQAACYVDRGRSSLAACVFDAAQALSVNFLKVYIRYQGLSMGEIEVGRLGACSEFIAQALMAEHQRRSVPQSVEPEAPVPHLHHRMDTRALAD